MNIKTLNLESKGVDSTSTNFIEKHIVKNPGPEKPDISSPSLDFVVQNISATEINNKYEDYLENNSFSSSNNQPSRISSPEGSTNFDKSPEKIEQNAEIDLIDDDDDLELKGLDVERVIQKQKTHDLFCPNCNSCITRRVILRKRKRRIPISDEEVKRNKIENVVGSVLGEASIQSRVDHVHRTDAIDDNDAQISTVDEGERERGPDIFRCLSCFSFFIPTGNGFKLFRSFGDKSGKENIKKEQVPPTPSVKKNWFTSMFASNNPETAVEQGSSFQTDARQVNQNAPSPPRASEGLVRTTGNIDTPVDGGDKILPFQKQKPTWLSGRLTNVTRVKFDTTRTETLDSTTEQFDLYTKDQLKESKSSKEVHISRENNLSITTVSTRSQITNGESAEDDVSFSQLGGSKLLISSSNVSTSEEGQITKQTMQLGDHVTEPSQHIIKETEIEVHSSEPLEVNNISVLKGVPFPQGEQTVIDIDLQPAELSQTLQDITSLSETASLLPSSARSNIASRERTGERREYKFEVIKSIVYGGLAELITSLSVVSSAVGGGAGTLNILALGMANLIGGLFIICHNLWELKCDNHIEQVTNQISDQAPEQRDRYKELLGRRQNFILHAIVSIISYVVFGLVPPVIYGFSFQKTDDKQLKLVVVAAASLLCIVVLAIGRAHVRRPPKSYLKSVITFVVLGFMVSGVSYAAGELVERLLEKLGLFETSSVSNLVVDEMMRPTSSAWASY